MSQTTERNRKLLALQAAINGNAEPLKEFKLSRGRSYSDAELEERRLYLSDLSGKQATLNEAIDFFGDHEPVGGGHGYQLPNGLFLFF